jgi:phosphoserine phosphatase
MDVSVRGKVPIALLDWDGTLRDGWTLPGWLDVLSGATDLRRTFEADAQEYATGEISHDALVLQAQDLYLEALRPHDPDSVRKIATEFVAHDRGHLRPFAVHLLEQLHRLGLNPTVISGAPLFVLREYATFLPLKDVWGLDVTYDGQKWEAGRNTGLSVVKASIVRELTEAHRVLVAFGDSQSDVPLLDAAELPVVVGSKADAPARSFRMGTDGSDYELLLPRLGNLLDAPH